MGKNFWAKLKKGFKSLISFCKKTHREGPFKVHKKLHKFNWYAAWHKHPHHKKVHAAVLIVYVLSFLVSVFILPTQTQAALTTRTITKSSLAEFAQGTLDDLLNENDALSMHLGKKVNTGNSTTRDDLNSYSGRSVTRTSDGKIHIVWVKKEVTPKIIYASSSVDEGSTWEIPQEVATDQNATGVLVKVDGSNNVHIFWAVADPGKNYVKHRVRGSDTLFGTIRTIPTNEMDGAIADWQAIPQGDHYGNYYDTVSGTLANVTRAGSKTIYDPVTGRIHDVPANYLGVRPYSNSHTGGLGYEAIIEESRTNYALNSYFNADANSDGLSDNFYNDKNTTGAATNTRPQEGIYGTYAQRMQYTGDPADTGKYLALINEMTADGTVAEGQTATASGWIKSNSTGANPNGIIYWYTNTGVYISQTNVNITLGSSYSYVTWSATAPATATRFRWGIRFSAIDSGDTVDVTVSAAQLEKGSAPTSYIPTTTATVTRNADVVTVPTTNWSQSAGTVFSVAKRNDSANTNNDYFSIFNNTNDRLFMRNGNGDSNFFIASYDGTGNSIANSPTQSGMTLLGHVAAGRWGTDTKAYLNGTAGAAAGAAKQYSLASMMIGGCSGFPNVYFNGFISRLLVYDSSISDSFPGFPSERGRTPR